MKEYKDDNFIIKLEDGITHIICLTSELDFEAIDTGIKNRILITGNEHCVILGDIRKLKKISREARQRLSATDGGEGVAAVAFVLNSKLHKIMFNFFHSIYKAPAPTKLFNDKEKAINWLEQFKK